MIIHHIPTNELVELDNIFRQCEADVRGNRIRWTRPEWLHELMKWSDRLVGHIRNGGTYEENSTH